MINTLGEKQIPCEGCGHKVVCTDKQNIIKSVRAQIDRINCDPNSKIPTQLRDCDWLNAVLECKYFNFNAVVANKRYTVAVPGGDA